MSITRLHLSSLDDDTRERSAARRPNRMCRCFPALESASPRSLPCYPARVKRVKDGHDRRREAEAEFRHELSALGGLPGLGAVAVAGFPTRVPLHLGEPLELAEPLREPHVPEPLRTHEGEFLLYVGCAWRLDSPTEVVTGPVHDDELPLATLAGLARLEGASLIDIRISGPAFDLEVTFTKDLILRIFCDRAQADGDGNYLLITGSARYRVGPAGALTLELLE